MKLRKSLESFLHILMPRVCCGCDRALHIHEELLCLDCLFHLPITDFHLDKNNESARQLWGKLDFEYTFSMLYLSKSSCVEKLLHRLKFKGFSEIGEYFGEKYAISLLDIHSKQPFDFIIPIPIHPSKLRIRGYNQAECFAKGLAKGLNVPLLNDVLFKTKLSASQTTKSRTERYENVEHVFGIKEDKSLLENKHVLLVDDVLTTGATLCAAGNMLKDRGALVSIATLARA